MRSYGKVLLASKHHTTLQSYFFIQSKVLQSTLEHNHTKILTECLSPIHGLFSDEDYFSTFIAILECFMSIFYDCILLEESNTSPVMILLSLVQNA